MRLAGLLLCLVSLYTIHHLHAEELSSLGRPVRQLGLGNLLNPINNQNQGGRRGPSCVGPQGQRGKCLSMDQCVLRELNEDYVKNKGFLCAVRQEGPVGVCCPDSLAKPVVYRDGMFGKNSASGKTEIDSEDLPQDV